MKKENEIVKMDSGEQLSLIKDLRQIIEQARGHVAATANYELSMMYWHIGARINRDVLGNQRAEYGKQIVSAVSTELQKEYGKKGFDEKNIRRMMQFAKQCPDEQIVASVMRQLSWTHILQVLSLKDALQREFYLSLAASERWSVRQLRKEIDGMLYERTAISGKLYPSLDAFNEKDLLKAHGVMMEALVDNAGSYRRGGVGVYGVK